MVRGTISSLAVIASASALLSGCASYQAMPFIEQGSASTLVEHRERDGIHVAVRDLSASHTAEKHFGRDLQSYGFVPVMVLIEMDADSHDAFVVRREELQLVLRDGTRLSSVDPELVIGSVAFSHWRSAFAFMFLLPGPSVVSSVNTANRDLEEDYLRKSLRSVRVSPNMREYQGVVFFQVPEDPGSGVSCDDAFVEVTIYKEARKAAGTPLGARLEFPVHFSD
jgi:hypothetical protein